jgi:hypothetical protein
MSLSLTDRCEEYSAVTVFLVGWFKGCNGRVELRAIHDGKLGGRVFLKIPQDLLTAPVWIEGYRGTNLYFGACPRIDGSSGREMNLQDLPGLWVDMDFKCIDGGEEGAREILAGFEHTPTFVIATGGGFHAYWKFSYPVKPTPERKQELKQLCVRLHGDPAATDLSRVLRLPGTFNFKYAPPKAVVLLGGFDD